EGLTVGAGAIGAAAIVRRGDSALCDAYSWADGRFMHEELLWRDEIAATVDASSERGVSFLPTRLGRPRRRVARPIVSHGESGGVDSVLFKPPRLSEDEFDQIKDHPRRGARIIDAFNRSATVLGIVFHHHERSDGRGYPAGLRGIDIPLAARIVNVADAFDAMTTNRPYGTTKTHAEATIELQDGAGSQFDPQVVAALIRARGTGRI